MCEVVQSDRGPSALRRNLPTFNLISPAVFIWTQSSRVPNNSFCPVSHWGWDVVYGEDRDFWWRHHYKCYKCDSMTYYTSANRIQHSLTYSTVQSLSWEANWFAASQEIPRNSRNSKVHYRTHKRPPPVSILGQPNPVYMPTSHLLEIGPNNR